MESAPSWGKPEQQVAQCCRVAHALGLADLRGAVSARTGDGRIAFGPVTGRGMDVVTPEEVALFPEGETADPAREASVKSDEWHPQLAAEAAVHAAIYRARPDVGGIAHVYPLGAMASAIAGKPLLPVTHQESDLALRPPARWTGPRLPAGEREIGQFLAALGDANVCHLPGEGVLVLGPSPRAAVVRAHYLELLARNTLLVKMLVGRDAAAQGRLSLMTAEEVARHLADRPDWDHFWRYYASLDARRPAVSAGAPLPWTREDGEAGSDQWSPEEKEIRAKLSLACRILYRYGLCAYLEHVSVRVPGTDTFLINPLGDLGAMTPDQLATVTFDGQWIGGPHHPPGHKWLHAEIFRSRPDVLAIVHTHQPLGRIFAIMGRPVPPLQVPGAVWLQSPSPIHPSPDLLFNVERARAVVRDMGDHHMVHQRGHGVEYVAQTLEEATFAALATERQAQLALLAVQMGAELDALPVIGQGVDEGWTPEEWWVYFCRQLQNPVPAWAAPYPWHW